MKTKLRKKLKKSKATKKAAKPKSVAPYRWGTDRQKDLDICKLYHQTQDLKRTIIRKSARVEEKPKPVFIGNLEPDDRESEGKVRVAIRPTTEGVYKVKLEGLRPLEVYRWAETLRDLYEEEGEFLPVSGLLNYLSFHVEFEHHADRALAIATVKTIYAEEYDRDRARAAAWERAIVNRAREAEEGPATAFPKERSSSPRSNIRNGLPGVEVTTSEGKKGGKRFWVFGHPVTHLIRWMGANAWTEEDVWHALKKLGIPDVKEITVKCQLIAGRKGPPDFGGRGKPPELTNQQEDSLEKLIDDAPKPKAKPQKPVRPKLDLKEHFDLYGKGKDPAKVAKKKFLKQKGKVKR